MVGFSTQYKQTQTQNKHKQEGFGLLIMVKKSTWRTHPARAIILYDLENGHVPLDAEQMSAEVAFHQHYQHNVIIQSVGFAKFQEKLFDHRLQVLDKKGASPQSPGFPWRKSEAKCIVLEDLYRGVLSLENNAKAPKKKWNDYYKAQEEDLTEDNEAEKFNLFKARLEKTAMTAEQAWEKHYKHLPAFKEVKLAQFKARLADHRSQVKSGKKRSIEIEKMWREDLKRYPPKTKRDDGKPVWNNHPAKDLLKTDVEEGKQKQTKPKDLRQSKDEYKDFLLKEFRGHIYQANRRRRFCNFLNDKREEKKIIHRCKPPVGLNDNTLAERLQAFGIVAEEEDGQEEMDVDGRAQIQYVTKGTDTHKRQINEEPAPSHKAQKIHH